MNQLQLDVLARETLPPGEDETQRKTQRSEIQQHIENSVKHETDLGPVPVPDPSCVSMKSDWSMQSPPYFSASVDERINAKNHLSGVSCASSWTNSSKEDIINFKALPSADQISHHRKDLFSFQPNDSDCHLKGCEPSTKKRKLACSDWTEPDLEPGFKNSDSRSRNGLHDANHRFENESMKFTRHQSTQQHFNSIFMVLEENIVAFVKNELNHISKAVASGCPEDGQSNVKDVSKGEDEEQKRSSREAVLKLAMNFLRMMKQEKLADLLQCGTSAAVGQRKLKSKLKKSFQCVFEGIAREGNPICLNQIYTELFVTAGGRTSVSDQHEFMQIETASRNPDKGETKITHEQIFESSPEKLRPIRAVMTKGVAGIGKTVLTQKFALDWAEDKTNQDVHFVFPFMFRELNVLKEKKFSLMELVHHFFTETKEICEFEKFPVVFIFDGLDECRLPLDFHNNEILTDVAQSASVDVLLTNLMRGYLLPSARLWITTRPAAANQIPPECVDMVTEVRGFADLQKEHYFMKRIRDEEQARRIISHIKTTKSLHLMCHIPVFCWITATVLEEVFKTRDGKKLPKTLTEMYIHFLVVQTKVKSLKYDGEAELDHWSPENRKMIKSLGKLAFEQLQKGNLIFNESDLENCGIDIRAVSVSSGVFTQIFKEEKGGLYQDKVFTFVHLSVQEFLAALYVHLMFFNSDVNLLEDENSSEFEDFYQSAVNIALKSPNGHLDLFLRFLLGLSLQSNQTLLQGLLRKTSVSPQTDISPITIKNTSNYIKKKLNEGISVDKSISLLYCLNELNDLSLVEKIQESLALEQLSTDELSPADWSALAFLLLSSEKDLDVFELKKYSASEEAFLRLLPVVKAANKALLSGCNLSGGSFESLSLVLSSHPSVLRELDLSNNDLKDSGVKQLSAGLRSPNCKLEILGLSVCNLNKRSCEMLSSVLSSKSSVLREMDLSNNDLQDAGVKLLSSGLESPHCKLQKLRLSGCLVTEEGCRSLFSALSSNPSHLTELDLSYNHPGEAAGKLFSAKLQDQNWKLDVLRMEPFGERWLRPGLRKYYFKTTFDPNTINRQIKLSDDDSRAVHVREDQSYPDHPERFQDCPQLLCSEDLTGRHYWEVDWSGWVDVSVSYRGISRRVERADCRFGGNEQSWSLSCSDGGGYYVYHQKKRSFISHSSAAPKKVAVYVDYPAGSVSFFRGCGDALIHLYTFSTTFTEPLCPGVGFRFRFRSKTDSFALLYSV
ncbi:NACHT, LRR and PYD domains-containing protein 3-like isoform X1 [Poecilia reticulata]|uniref:NACHT, LRR and PYD domains-containing protein 3-like isoform X1 n=1 Tax=Poecilia reticulata TaxID=8081 RepID=UPI0004A3F910|nr:PREDICTED: NACHT, LRR and PYD domains-containing protein 3-like isoform X1 [Poecilia reticulata]